MLMTISDGTVL